MVCICVCKTVYAGSIPAVASNLSSTYSREGERGNLGRPSWLPRPFCNRENRVRRVFVFRARRALCLPPTLSHGPMVLSVPAAALREPVSLPANPSR